MENDQDVNNYLLRAKEAASHSPCKNLAKVGCVIVVPAGRGPKELDVVFVSYNSSNEANPEVDQHGEWVSKPHVLHAEEKAVAEAANEGEPLMRAAVYLTHSPCFRCARLLWACGVREIYYLHDWWDHEAVAWLREQSVLVHHVRLDKK